MNKLLSFFLLVFAFGSASASRDNTAQAAPISGKVGVGTYDTQAEFTNVKVVKGTTTLYQSDFTTGMADWATFGGTWDTQNGSLRQTGGEIPAMAWVGDSSWNNYTLTLRARKTGGNEGFLITFGAPGNISYTWWNIGGWGNTKHGLQVPGITTPEVGGSIQTGVWYDIKVQLDGSHVRCYLNGALIQQATRIVDFNERGERIQEIQNSAGYQLLSQAEKDSFIELFNRSIYLGAAARDTFNAMPGTAEFASLDDDAQVAIIRAINRKRLTFNTGYGFGGDAYRDQTIINSMDAAVMQYNAYGVFDKHVTANNDPGVPTADANYDGWMRFGQQMSYRTALHELAHTLGVGTYWAWRNFMANGIWTGMYTTAQVKQFDGADAVIRDAGIHFYPYGLNYDNESSPVNDYRHVMIVAAMRRDMGIANTLWMPSSTSVPNGTYRLMPRHAQASGLEVQSSNPANGAPTDISAYTGAANQNFLLDLQTDGTYRIRTSLVGKRPLELPYGIADNGNQIKLWDDNGNSAQRWYLVPMGDGWYKIAPKNNIGKSMDVAGGPGGTADGTIVQSWDYLDGTNQQWRFVPVSTTSVTNGTYRLTPRHAPNSALSVKDSNLFNGAQLDIRAYAGGANQKFLLDLLGDGSYRMRTSLAGNRSLDLFNGDTANGTKINLWDDNDGAMQHWYFFPSDDGWYHIAPKLNTDKAMDVLGGPPATGDGSIVNNWDYLGGTNQQWSLIPIDNNSAPVLSDVTLTPTSPKTNSVLAPTFTTNDADNDKVTVSYVWKKNGTVIQDESGKSLDLSKSGNGDKGDKITVTMIATDGVDSSPASTSQSVTIANSSPVVTQVTLTPTQPLVTQTLTAAVQATDADGDTLTYSYVWKKNGNIINGETTPKLNLLKPGNGAGGDTITVIITAKDGETNGESVTSEAVTVTKIINSAPCLVSVLPAMSSDIVGAKRTFAIRAIDSDGASDIESVWLLINDRLNWSEGATLIYVPDAATPSKGLLYLRQGDAFLAPVPVGTGTNSSAVLDNGAVSITAKEATVSVLDTAITVTLPLTIREGLSGENTLFGRVQDRQYAVDDASLAGDQGYVRSGFYTVTSQFVAPTNSAPTVGALTPSATSTTLTSGGIAPAPQNFVLQVKDAEGMADIDTVWFLAAKTRSWGNSATFVYVARTKRLYLRSDDGSQWLGGGIIGFPGTIENSQVRLNLAKVTVALSNDGKGFALTLPLEAKRGLLGSNKIWLRAQDKQGATTLTGDDQGYVAAGTWNVTQSADTGSSKLSNGRS
ncbi:hypothetical protein EON83_21220 [bacterium]|nr:MAG: hypothetical protein EON83_21220 [bacterium]